jgi:hypothetical protein
MANAPRSSFIPRQVTGITPQSIRRKRVFSIFGFLSVVLLLASLLASGALFAYERYISGQLDSEKAALAAEYAKFDESDIASVRSFDSRLQVVKTLLDSHLAVSKIFDALEANTKESVQYSAFSYQRRPSGNATLSITGVTDDFSKISLQWAAYLKNTMLANAILTKIALGSVSDDSTVQGGAQAASSDGTPAAAVPQVGFSLVANLSASDLAYSGVVARPATTTAPAIATSTVSSATASSTTPAGSAATSTEGASAAGTVGTSTTGVTTTP